MVYFFIRNINLLKINLKYFFTIYLAIIFNYVTNKYAIYYENTNLIGFQPMQDLSIIVSAIKLLLFFSVIYLNFNSIKLNKEIGINSILLRMNKRKFLLFVFLNCCLITTFFSFIICLPFYSILKIRNIIQFAFYNLFLCIIVNLLSLNLLPFSKLLLIVFLFISLYISLFYIDLKFLIIVFLLLTILFFIKNK